MRTAGWILFAFALGPAPAQAEDSQVKRGPAPDWVVPSELMTVPDGASGTLFVRRQDIVAHLDDRGQAQYLGYRMRLLHPNALQLGNISIAWNPVSGPPIIHMINVHRDGMTIDVLKNASFEILRREDQLEAAMLDGMLTAVLRVPDLRVGDELEVALTTRSNDPTMAEKDSGLLFLFPSPQPGRFRLGLSWDEGHKPNFRMTPDMEAVARRGDHSVDFPFDNPGTMAPPKDAPSRYQWQRMVEYSDFADWAAVSRHFAPLYAKAARLPEGSPLKAEARRIALTHAGPLDRAAAALKLVQQDVRYIYVGLGSGNLLPPPPTRPGSAVMATARARPRCCSGCSQSLASRRRPSSSIIRAMTTASTKDCRIRHYSTMYLSVRASTAGHIGSTARSRPSLCPRPIR